MISLRSIGASVKWSARCWLLRPTIIVDSTTIITIFYNIIHVLSCRIPVVDCLAKTFDENQFNLLKRWIMKQQPNTSWNLATGDIAWGRVIFQKHIDCAEFKYSRTVHHNFWLPSYERFKYTRYEIQTQIFTWPGMFWNQT